MENELTCCVCLDKTETILSCNHLCCVSCIKKIIKINSLCPLCRSKFDTTPYKYVPPKRLNNLKISIKQKKSMSRFLNCRMFLLPCKKQRLYSSLLYKYTAQISFQNKYIHIDCMLLNIITYDVNYLIDCLIWLHHPNNRVYNSSIRLEMIYAIRSTICSILI